MIYLGVAKAGTGPLLGEIDSALPAVPLFASSGILAAQENLTVPADAARIEAVGPALAPERAGYDAMRLVLESVEEGGRDRKRVIAAALRLREHVAAARLARLPARRGRALRARRSRALRGRSGSGKLACGEIFSSLSRESFTAGITNRD